MRALYFGTYDRDYPRNAQVISCLRAAGVEVLERHVGVWEGRRDAFRAGAGTAARIAAAELRLLNRTKQPFDVVLVGYPGHFDLPAARPADIGRVRWVDYQQLPGELHRAGCALGIFGTSAKAQRVIPNKAFQALACGTPLVTADTPAARELLAHEESALLVPSGDPEALAQALRRVAADPALRSRLSEGGLAAYRRQASEDVLGRRWRGLLERVAA